MGSPWEAGSWGRQSKMPYVVPPQELGADEAVDYTEQRFEEVFRGRPFDAVIDMVGGEPLTFVRTCCYWTCLFINGPPRRCMPRSPLPCRRQGQCPCMHGCCAGDYKPRSLAVVRRGGAYVSVAKSG